MKTQIGYLSFFALVLSAVAFANEVRNLPQVNKITDGQPEEVIAFIVRIVECNHWAGEEPYDKERAKQIRKAIENARCNSLALEEKAFDLKYKENKKVLDAIGKAKELNM